MAEKKLCVYLFNEVLVCQNARLSDDEYLCMFVFWHNFQSQTKFSVCKMKMIMKTFLLFLQLEYIE